MAIWLKAVFFKMAAETIPPLRLRCSGELAFAAILKRRLVTTAADRVVKWPCGLRRFSLKWRRKPFRRYGCGVAANWRSPPT